MSHSFVQNYVHVVFSTKDREKLLSKPMQPKLWAYMAGIARNHEFLVLANGGMEDHVHLLLQLPPTLTLAQAISLIKANSSRWIGEHGMRFAWQEGYGGFGVSKSNRGVVEKYIANQEKHHKRMTFEREFLGLLKKHEIEFDPKYVFG
jgi:REP element-mobilizing transposase RayT